MDVSGPCKETESAARLEHVLDARSRKSDDRHLTGEYITAREVFSTRQEADGRVAELEALGLAGVPVEG